MMWPWRLLALVLFVVAMIPVWIIARWLPTALPGWFSSFIGSALIGALICYLIIRWYEAHYGRDNILPPD